MLFLDNNNFKNQTPYCELWRRFISDKDKRSVLEKMNKLFVFLYMLYIGCSILKFFLKLNQCYMYIEHMLKLSTCIYFLCSSNVPTYPTFQGLL